MRGRTCRTAVAHLCVPEGVSFWVRPLSTGRTLRIAHRASVKMYNRVPVSCTLVE